MENRFFLQTPTFIQIQKRGGKHENWKFPLKKSGLVHFAHNKQILTYCNRSLMKIDVHQEIPFLIWKQLLQTIVMMRALCARQNSSKNLYRFS